MLLQDLLLIHWPGVARTDATSPVNAELRWQTWQVGDAADCGISVYTHCQLRGPRMYM